MNDDLHRQLVSIFSYIFQVQINPEIKDISSGEISTWDSINKLRLILELEEFFNVALTDEEALTLTSLCAAKEVLAKKSITCKPGKARIK